MEPTQKETDADFSIRSLSADRVPQRGSGVLVQNRFVEEGSAKSADGAPALTQIREQSSRCHLQVQG